ncbi:MAG: hypothetical protein EOP22_02685 [Hyphomicrobiales bacterium]|nr:MAG: hypothetical protein EOP22_02685 [Hyphomicrobiales bacterium]
MGNPIEMKLDLDIEVEDIDAEERAPGQGWTVSQDALDEMREIDARIRAAEQMSGNLVVG